MEKKCSECGQTKPLTEFYKNSTCVGGYRHECKKCTVKNQMNPRDHPKERRKPKILAIEEEFDEPFADIVKGFALMGYSRNSVAMILEISHGYFNHLCRSMDLNKHFKKRTEWRKECRGNVTNHPKKSDEYYLNFVRQYPERLLFHEKAPVGLRSIQRRFGGFTEAKRLAGVI